MTNKQKFYPVGNRRFSFRAFTLIELLVVIAIFGLLVSIALVSLKAAREKAKITAVLHFSAQVHHALGAYAVGIWDFETGYGITAKDTSGNDNDGMIYGASWSWTKDTPTQSGYGLSFGGNDYINCGNKESLNITDRFTISAWIKPTGSGYRMIVGKRDVSFVIYYFAVEQTNNYLSWVGYDPNQRALNSNTQLTMNKWSHVVITYQKGNKISLYINGQEDGSRDAGTGLVSSAANTFIGSDTSGSPYLFDEVHIYEESLTQAQIKKLYVKGAEKRGLLAKE